MNALAPRGLAVVAAVALLALARSAGAADGTGPSSGNWTFSALLDGKPIGEHRFTLRTEDGQRVLHSDARFDVKLLGFTAYRYRHADTEHWQGDCLVSMDAKTDDDGKALAVNAKKQGDGLAVTGPEGTATLDGCVMSFAYWNKAILKQSRLLNAQTGKYEDVKIASLGKSSVQSQGKTVEAEHYRITGPKEPIELWYAPDGDWLALESSVSDGKRKLRYQRQ